MNADLNKKGTIWDRLGSVAAYISGGIWAIWALVGMEVGSEPVPGVMAVAAR